MHARLSHVPSPDASNLHVFAGTYGEYLMGKVGKVFPAPGAAVLP